MLDIFTLFQNHLIKGSLSHLLNIYWDDCQIEIIGLNLLFFNIELKQGYLYFIQITNNVVADCCILMMHFSSNSLVSFPLS